jgi:hypothetical protein
MQTAKLSNHEWAIYPTAAIVTMNLPNPEASYIDIRKLRDYSLNPNHDHGKHKARLFLAILGLDISPA